MHNALKIKALVVFCSLLLGCNNNESSVVDNVKISIVHPTEEMKAARGLKTYFLMEIQGKFIIENGCLLFQSQRRNEEIAPKEVYSVVVPEGTKILKTKSGMKVINPDLNLSISLNENFQGGGGFDSAPVPVVEAAIPAECRRNEVLALQSWSKLEK